VLCAFELLELYGADLRRQPLQQRKATLAELLRDVHACALGCEGIACR
jgi:ATP-dependent DNA ligase